MHFRSLGAATAALALLCATQAQADRVSTSSAPGLSASQLGVLEGRASTQYAGSVRFLPPRTPVPQELQELRIVASPAPVSGKGGAYRALALAAAQRHGIPEDLFLRLVQQESGWNANAVSRVGALGLAQLMPGTARLLRVDPTDPRQNLEGGARYLRMQHDTFGDWRLALAAYNAGPGAVQKYGGVPPYAETQHYVKAILGR